MPLDIYLGRLVERGTGARRTALSAIAARPTRDGEEIQRTRRKVMLRMNLIENLPRASFRREAFIFRKAA